MKKALLRPLSFAVLVFALAQAYGQQHCFQPRGQEVLNGNNVRTVILNGGDLFWDGDNGRFQVPYQPGGPGTIFAQGLWLGAIAPGGNLRVAAQSYGRGNGQADYWAGPLNEEGLTSEEACNNWDRAFSVLRHQIETHIADFEDNGVIDNPIPEIMGWPGLGNPHFSGIYGFELPDAPQGLAPFADEDGDGLYDPLAGDYPMTPNSAVIPGQITWVVFNDNGNIHTESSGDPLQVEVQLTSWAFDCSDNAQLNNTIFVSYKLINRGAEPLDSLHLGLWTDFDLGCHTDDFMGSAPGLNTFFAYNSDNEDGPGCPLGLPSYGQNPPVQAITVLNNDLSYLMYYENPGAIAPPPAVTDPNAGIEFYRYLTGHWRDGTPLTSGGSGYDPTLSNPVANFAFPGDPNNPAEWSALSAGLADAADQRAIGSVFLGELLPGAVSEVDFGYTFFREEGADFLGNVTAMYEGIPLLQSWYDNNFETACTPPVCESESDCVWPGDLNADGIANHYDLLAIGLGAGQSGPTRPAPYNWSPRSGEAWAGEQTNGANDKHLDADGDGQAEYEDFLLTEEHYNLRRPGYQPLPAVYREGPELSLTPFGASNSFDDIDPGQEFLFSINLQEVPGLYGLAFSLDFDTTYFDYIYASSGGFGREELEYAASIGHILRGRAVPGQADFARLAPDPSSTIEGGAIFSLVRLKVKDEFTEPLPTNQAPIRFKNIKAIRSDGTEIEIGGATVTATVNGIVTDTEETLAAGELRLFPNPTNGQLELRFPGQRLSTIELLDARGRSVWRGTEGWQDSASLDFAHLPTGVYFLRADSQVRKVVIGR
ncbi:MAG: T9SS type A sorting domain-containing protein [Phaeodactylibacter sp.]|nr:T9SS type A sorting domain-containing protein [Phaeodactylibacter sp.]